MRGQPAETGEAPPYSRRQWALAVNLAALLGWAAVVLPDAVDSGWRLLAWSAIVGLPIAFLACWAIAAPILRRVMRRPVSWARAAGWGAVVSGLIAGVGVAIDRAAALARSELHLHGDRRRARPVGRWRPDGLWLAEARRVGGAVRPDWRRDRVDPAGLHRPGPKAYSAARGARTPRSAAFNSPSRGSTSSEKSRRLSIVSAWSSVPPWPIRRR